jgi:hypothetical protein
MLFVQSISSLPRAMKTLHVCEVPTRVLSISGSFGGVLASLLTRSEEFRRPRGRQTRGKKIIQVYAKRQRQVIALDHDRFVFVETDPDKEHSLSHTVVSRKPRLTVKHIWWISFSFFILD